MTNILYLDKIRISPRYLDLRELVRSNYIQLGDVGPLVSSYSWLDFQNRVKLSEKFINRFALFLNWHEICLTQSLSESLMRRYWDRLNWEGVSKFQIFSKQFAQEFKNLLNWEIISKRDMFDLEFLLLNKPNEEW